jgi:uncharacterized damage-inducible protein DinB
MQVAEVRALYDYNAWANSRLLDTAARVTAEQFVAPAAFSQGGLRGTLVHTLGAERIWRERLQGRQLSPPLREADFPDVGTLAARWREEEARLDAYLATLRDEDLHREVRSTTRTGEQVTDTLWYLLAHVVNHGTQQRGDAAVLLTRYGCSPGGLDFADFARERVAATGRERGD